MHLIYFGQNFKLCIGRDMMLMTIYYKVKKHFSIKKIKKICHLLISSLKAVLQTQ